VDHTVWRDPEQVAVVGDMVDRAQGNAVDDRRRAQRVAVFDDVRGLQERRRAQGAHRAACAVRAEDPLAQTVLVKNDMRLPRDLATGKLAEVSPADVVSVNDSPRAASDSATRKPDGLLTSRARTPSLAPRRDDQSARSTIDARRDSTNTITRSPGLSTSELCG